MSEAGSIEEIKAPHLVLRLPPEPARLLRARERIRDYLRLYCAEQDVIDEIVLCIEEAATNVIRHSGSKEEMEIALRFEGNDLLVEVADKGPGFDATALDLEAIPDLTALGGRGLFLISKLMDELRLERGDGFRVRMLRRSLAQDRAYVLESALGELGSEGSLSHREIRLRVLLEELDEAFLALDWQYRYVYANQAALRMTGRSAAELLGRTPVECFPALAESPFMAHLRAAMELGTPSVFEHRSVVNGDWLEIRIYPTPAGVSVYYREINERKHTEEELASSHERLASILGTISDGFYTLDRHWRLSFVNDKAAAYFQGSKEELLGHDFWQLFPEMRGTVFEKSKRQAMAAGEASAHEAYYAPLGLWIEERVYPSVDGLTVLFTDITQRKQAEFERQEASEELHAQGEELRTQGDELRAQAVEAESASEALRASRSDYQQLFAAMSSGFAVHKIILDGEGRPADYRFLEVNAAFEELTGLRAEEIIGRSALEVLPGLEPSWIAAYGKVALGGGPARFDDYSASLDRHYEVLAYSPSPGRFATIFTDISERKRAEDERQQLAASRYARSLIEASLDPLVTISAAGKITDVNAATEQATGLERGALIGSDFSDYFTEPERARAGYQQAFQEGLVRDYPLAIRHASGAVTDVLYNATVFRDESGKVVGVFAAARDVTERNRAQAEALKNARALEHQQRIATALQENFVHPLPRIDGLELAELSLPAGRDELVGGDFHDVFVLSDGNVVALIGDVMGKGIKAAGFTETVRAAVRTLALLSASPQYILANVNRLLLHEGEHQQLVTALLVMLDPRKGQGTLASAGHPPAVHISAHGRRLIEPQYGLPLGAADQSYAATDFALAAGDALVLYTDGLTEARRDGELFGEQRLLEVLGTAPDGHPRHLIEHLQEAVVSFAHELRDDLQILVLRRPE